MGTLCLLLCMLYSTAAQPTIMSSPMPCEDHLEGTIQELSKLLQTVHSAQDQLQTAGNDLAEMMKDLMISQEKLAKAHSDLELTQAQHVAGMQYIQAQVLALQSPTGHPRDCSEVPGDTSGEYMIYPEGNSVHHDSGFRVYCDQTTDGGGWLVFQRRQDGSENFYRPWEQYAHGFGTISAEFWLGNDLLSSLTSQRDYRIRFDLWDHADVHKYAQYAYFRVATAEELYTVSFTSYSGDAGDAFSRHRHSAFSTAERDHDIDPGNCAKSYGGGGWWYEACYNANLNGVYYPKGKDNKMNGIEWNKWHEWFYSLKRTEMKIRPLSYIP